MSRPPSPESSTTQLSGSQQEQEMKTKTETPASQTAEAAREQLQAETDQTDEDRGEDEDEAEELAIDEPPLETGSAPPSHRGRRTPTPVPRRDHLLLPATCAGLVLATFWGVLARLGLIWLGTFASTQVLETVWPQIVGCFVMGLVAERKLQLDKIYPPLFVALGTGFCGSLTTFSTWMGDVFFAFAGLDASSPASRFSSFLGGVAITLVTISLSLSSLALGASVSSLLPALPSPPPHHHPHPPHLRRRPHLFLLVLSTLFYIGAILLLILGPSLYRSRATFALIFGPPGTLLRYLLSRTLNPLRPSLPLGTLSANTIAVLFFALAALLQRRRQAAPLGCAALQGVMDGFCGSLSTVSTFAVELRGLRKAEAWRYAGISWVVGQVVMVVVLGSWVWTTGERDVCTF